MKYSLIIATYNRLDELRELFSSLDRVEFDPVAFEIVIVDDGSSDGTEEFIKSLDTPYSIQYLKQSNQGPGAARNLGMTRAKGDYFIFIDSDVLLPENYLEEIDRYVTSHNVDAFGGPDDSHPSFSDFLKAVNYSMTSFLGTGGTRGSRSSITKFYPRSFNMGIHRRVYEKIGGMGGLRHGQDMDFSARIYSEGFSVHLIPDAVVFHKRRTSFWRFFKQIFNWGVARINLGRKHKGMLKPVHLLPAVLVLGFLILVLLSMFVPAAEMLLRISLVFAVIIALVAFLQATIRYHSLKVGVLAIATLFTQVGAYGLGLLYALWQVSTGKKEATGIVKNYYK